mmetsp:Transcript_116618/g.249353  ORF Transcript_116618/g.249353 Transcript_116618/m.249353 type:complete len:209 (+) Transcript_116618:280-906(+)
MRRQVVAETHTHQCAGGEVAGTKEGPSLEASEEDPTNQDEEHHEATEHHKPAGLRLERGAHRHPNLDDKAPNVGQDVAHERDPHEAQGHGKELATGRHGVEVPVAQGCDEGADKESGPEEGPLAMVLQLISASLEEVLQHAAELLLLLAELHILKPVLLALLELIHLAHLLVEEAVALEVIKLGGALKPREDSTSDGIEEKQRADAPC